MYSHGENRERAAEPHGWQRRGRIQPRRGGGGTAGPGGPPPPTPTSHLSSQNPGFACSILWSPVSLTPECCGPLGLWVGETEAGGSCSVG